ncbi:hypothetical protein DOY81_013265 [Sarcophaga bullata]|nr:hypothetical protein DOY81_013265 [Sarcophaga bullata]
MCLSLQILGNFHKLPDAKVQGIVWSELNESKWYNNIELDALDKLFSAYRKNGVASTNHRWHQRGFTQQATQRNKVLCLTKKSPSIS